MFRYATRYSPSFRDSFGAGYRSAGGVLPDEWWIVARLIDVTRLVRILNEDRELPSVFSDCRMIAEHLMR